MKCHLVFPQSDGRTGVAIKEALLDCNVNVLVSDPSIENISEMISKEAKRESDFVLMSRTEKLLAFMKYVRDNTVLDEKQTKWICWNTDKRRSMNHWGNKLLNLFRECDWIYTVAKGDVDRYKELGINAKWLSQGVHTSVFCKEVEDDPKYKCDVAFMGSYPSPLIAGKPVHKGRNELIQYVQNKCKEYNYSFRLYRPYDNTAVHGDELIKACRAAKVVLSHNGYANLGPSPSVRLYEVLVAGGNILEEAANDGELEKFLGFPICTYSSKEEAWIKIVNMINLELISPTSLMYRNEKISYYMFDINHSYNNRIKKILEDIKDDNR